MVASRSISVCTVSVSKIQFEKFRLCKFLNFHDYNEAFFSEMVAQVMILTIFTELKCNSTKPKVSYLTFRL